MLSTTPFFQFKNGLYTGNEGARGPWSADACHAGPPSAALAREIEQLCEKQLVRITINLGRPVPMAGFRIDARILKEGRNTAYATAELKNSDGIVCAEANALFHSRSELPEFNRKRTEALSMVAVSTFLEKGDECEPARKGELRLPSSGFGGAVEKLVPADKPAGFTDGAIPGDPGEMWMRTPNLVEGEDMSGFQRVCPMADCINALSINLDTRLFQFMNTDLTIALHRIPSADSEWFGMRGSANCHTDGLATSCGTLFDEKGCIGTAMQNIMLRSR